MNNIKSTSLEDLKIIAINLLLMMTFGLASLSKWKGGGVPDSFVNRFGETWIGGFPGGLFMSFYLITFLETAVFFMMLISLFRLEWLKDSNKLYLRIGLTLSLFIFVILGYGLRMSGDFGGAANLFFYFGATLIALFVVEKEVNKV